MGIHRIQVRIRKAGDRWRMRWPDDSGKDCRRFIGDRHTSKREAERIARAFELKLNAGEVPTATAEKITLGQAMEADTLLHADIHHATASSQQRALGRLAAVLKGSGGFKGEPIRCQFPLGKIGPAHIAKLKAAMKAAGLAENTRSVSLMWVRAFFNRMRAAGLYFPVNPVAGEKLKVTAKASRIFSPAEVGMMIQAAGSDDWMRAFVLLLANSGARLNELLHLRWTDLRLDAQPTAELEIQRATPGTVEVGGRAYPLLPWTAKNDSSYRVVPLPGFVADELRRLKLKSQSPYLFISLRRLAVIGRRVNAGTYRANVCPVNQVHKFFIALQVRAIREITCADEAGSPHDLRDSYVYLLKNGGISLDVIARLIGHSVGSTLGKFYTQLTPDDAVRVVQVLEVAAGIRRRGSGTFLALSGGGSEQTLA